MNIQEKVQDLLKYCSSYQGHTYMMDERRDDEAFQVLLPEEKMLLEEMGRLQFILLTGEAGDGKSHLLRNLSEQLHKNGFKIYSDFSAMLDEARGISRGVVTTAVELDDEHKNSIKNKLESQTERKLELEYVIDPSIIGGIVFRVGDVVYDASLRAQLDNLRESIKRGE